jgi:hypothetical protein
MRAAAGPPAVPITPMGDSVGGDTVRANPIVSPPRNLEPRLRHFCPHRCVGGGQRAAGASGSKGRGGPEVASASLNPIAARNATRISAGRRPRPCDRIPGPAETGPMPKAGGGLEGLLPPPHEAKADERRTQNAERSGLRCARRSDRRLLNQGNVLTLVPRGGC